MNCLIPVSHVWNRFPTAAATLLAAALAAVLLPLSAAVAAPDRVDNRPWPMAGRDMAHTNRARYLVPVSRQSSDFFDLVRWQTPTPGSPAEGNVSSGTLVFTIGSGPGGAGILVGGYHWPKGVMGLDRLTGARFWSGLPRGGEAIAARAPAFSNDGSVIYVTNDATGSQDFPAGHPLMAFSTVDGPAAYWHNGGMTEPNRLGMASPTIAPDGRIFLHGWNDRPHAGTDLGSAIVEAWTAENGLAECIGDPALFRGADLALKVVSAGRYGAVVAFDGNTGAELWRTATGHGMDATPSIDPANGNIYVAAGFADVAVVGLDMQGNPLWETSAVLVHDWVDGVNLPQRTAGAGALSHDGGTYYFQSNGHTGEGRLYAINTATGGLKWSLETGSSGWEMASSAPIVTPDGTVVVGNNNGGTYFALRDDGDHATVLDTLTVAEGGTARATATLSDDGLLYLPVRMPWTTGNGDGDLPSAAAENLFVAFDLADTTIMRSGFEADEADRAPTVAAVPRSGRQ